MGFGEYQEAIFNVLKELYDGEHLIDYEKIQRFNATIDNKTEIANYHKKRLEILKSVKEGINK